MVANPMQRKARNSFLLGMVITLIVCAIIGVVLYFLLSGQEKEKEEQEGTLTYAYKLKTSVQSGEEITFDKVESVLVTEKAVPIGAFPSKTKITNSNGKETWIDSVFPSGYKSKIDLSAGTILSYDLVYEGEAVTNDIRYVEYNMLVLPTTIMVGDYIDIRLTLPSGQDLIVVSKKEVKSMLGDTIGLELSEGEILMMESAIVEAYIMTASKLYAIQYIEPGIQEPARKTYTPTEAVQGLIQRDPNITAEAKTELQKRFNADIRTWTNADKNAYAANKFGYYDIVSQYVSEDFIEKWSAVIREYAVRYKEKIHGWLFHYSYDRLGFDGHDDDFFKAFNDAVRSGNKNALIAFNNGEVQVDYKNPIFQPLLGNLKHSNEITVKLLELARAGNELACSAFQRKPGNNKRYSKYEDFTAGETSYFQELPISKYVDGSLWHKIGFMGIPTEKDFPWPDQGWNKSGSIYSGDYLYDYIKKCNEKGGVVTIDFCMFDDCKFDWGQYEILKRLSSLR